LSVALDHLVVAAPSLAQGVAWCETVLGITPGPGGQHPLMGTHNRLFAIGSESFPLAFFEIIAIDPAAAAPGRARWFGLDAIDLGAGPRLLHWAARCDAIDARCATLAAAGFDAGRAIVASRDTPQGRLEWRLSVRDDGALLAGGALPTLIDWGATPPPGASMPASGVTLRGLTLRGLPAAAAPALELQGVALAADAGPTLTALLDTPRGRVILCSH
jgi:catechol 2,3-dioxygenase-like lactoylglutathione lyase family enzyme